MRLRVIVRGRVQGVGFRWFVREAARRVALAGWVKNRPDGGVDVAAEGEDWAIELLRSRLLDGPDGAVVSELEELPADEIEMPKPFVILR